VKPARVAVAKNQPAAAELGAQPEVAPAAAQLPLPEAPREAVPKVGLHSHRARGFFVNPDGAMYGQVNSIESGTLLLRPVPDALVTLVQNRRVIGQARTGRNGTFQISGVTPWAVYSIFISGRDSIACISGVARPVDHPDFPHHFRALGLVRRPKPHVIFSPADPY